MDRHLRINTAKMELMILHSTLEAYLRSSHLVNYRFKLPVLRQKNAKSSCYPLLLSYHMAIDNLQILSVLQKTSRT